MIEIPIQNLINEAVDEKREKKEQTSWHCSRFGSCLRGLYLERQGVEPEEGFDDRVLRIFSVGKIFEGWVIDLLQKQEKYLFDKLEEQVRIEDKELGISGYVDFIITDREGNRKPYEIKTKHSAGFNYLPNRQHEYQLWLYLKTLNLPEGNLLYLSKDDLRLQECPVFLKDKKLEKEVMNEVNLLNNAWSKQDITLLPLCDDKEWKAKYCRWHSKCKNGKV